MNDNICDCCDGSDEWDSNAACTNTCEEMGRQALEEQKRKKELHEQGFQLRLDYSLQGKKKADESRLSLNQKETELETIKLELETLQAAKDTAEEPEKAAKDRHHEVWEQEKEQKEKERLKSQARSGFDELDTNSDEYLSVEEIQARDELDDDGDGIVSKEEALEYLNNEQQINFETFLDSVWSLVSDKCHFKMPVVEDKPLLPTPPLDFEKVEEEDDDDYDYNEDEDEPPVDVDADQMPEYDEETKALIVTADEAREAYREAERRKTTLDREITDLNKFLGSDFGHDHEFASFYEECFEYTDLEYTYSMCAFGRVSQRSKSGGRETSLGTWGSWDKNYSVMKYENGEKCWNGPSRSATISLTCGLENRLLSASEPNRCEYAMEFSTPAVCEQVKHPHTEL